jgi:carboxyl-terminal processing protease
MKKPTGKILGSIAVGVILGFIITPLVSKENIFEQFEKYRYVFNMAYRNYVDTVDVKKLSEAAIRGMLKELDPHSVYIDEEKMKSVNEDFSGSFEGIGVQFDILNDTLTVISPISDGPSEKLGIMAGDKIVKIDGEKAVGIKRSEVPKKLRGAKGTHVLLDIKRSGVKDLIQFDVIRDKIPLYTMDAAYMIDGTDIGLVAMNRFAATTHKEMMEGVRKLKAKGMKKLILDLRGNPGGFLDQAFYMADEFIGKGDTIVYTKGRTAAFDEVKLASARGELEDMPVIVMVNAGSASASEIVSGAIQDRDRGLVVGTTSFGKGLVQRQYPMRDGSAFRLTIARYYTPSGRCIQRPYKNADAYRHLVGRLELEEGSNIAHTLDKLKNGKGDSTINLDSIDIYYTRAGRPVIGGGGVIPDYVVKSDTITDMSIAIRRKRIMYELVNNNLKAGNDIKAKYGKDFDKFYREYKVSDDIMKQFKKLALDKEVEWNDDDYKVDKDYYEVSIKALLARVAWGRSEYMKVFSDIDKQVQVAKTLFPEAEKIRKM